MKSIDQEIFKWLTDLLSYVELLIPANFALGTFVSMSHYGFSNYN